MASCGQQKKIFVRTNGQQEGYTLRFYAYAQCIEDKAHDFLPEWISMRSFINDQPRETTTRNYQQVILDTPQDKETRRFRFPFTTIGLVRLRTLGYSKDEIVALGKLAVDVTDVIPLWDALEDLAKNFNKPKDSTWFFVTLESKSSRLVGFVEGYVKRDQIHISYVGIHPQWRGKGLCPEMMTFLFEMLSKNRTDLKISTKTIYMFNQGGVPSGKCYTAAAKKAGLRFRCLDDPQPVEPYDCGEMWFDFD
jgi:ribosomal protein S18 acetylase RimI-like enzyme